MFLNDSSREVIATASARLDTWIERQEFKGWDPHDALNSPLLKSLAFRNRRVGQTWVQLLKRIPINLRPIFGVPKGYNPKGMGLFLASYWRKFLLTGQPAYLERIHFFFNWLQTNTSPGYSGTCWGYHFDWPNRGFFAPAGTPTIVNTAFIGLAFLDCSQLSSFQHPISNLQSPLSVARSACEFILKDLNRLVPSSDKLCFSYTPLDRRYIHNANLMGAWLLGEVATHTEEGELAQHALAAARYTAHHQKADGSWSYGEGIGDSWVDNFHTGFVLVALKNLAACLKTDEFDEAIHRGYDFWKEQFFLADGTPKYYPNQVYPIDSHSVAQGILTFMKFADIDPQAIESAWRVALWGIEHMQDPQGFFMYQIQPHYHNRIPYMRWSQAWMQRALTELMYIDAQAVGTLNPLHSTMEGAVANLD